jgi:hypothetical protein
VSFDYILSFKFSKLGIWKSLVSAFLGLNFAVYGVDLLMGQATLLVALITSLIHSLSLSLSLSSHACH